jgi:hypothetical protein
MDPLHDKTGLTSPQRRLRAQLAANTRWAHTRDRKAATAQARSKFDKRFENQVDPDRTLPPAERAELVASARSAYFQRLALKSSQARARRTSGDAA